MNGKRLNTPAFIVTRDNRFNLPAHWLGKLVNGVRIQTIIINLEAK